MTPQRSSTWLALTLALVACGDGGGRSDTSVAATTSPSTTLGESDGTDASGTATAASATAATDATGAMDSTGAPGPTTTVADSTGAPPGGLETLGALVVLGDSISDGGGQAPYYYDLLRADLAARYGAIQYENQAQSGSETDALLGQANDLPGTLPGPVAVVITSGGNDMKAAIGQIVTGADGPARMQMQSNIAAALAELTAPGRFGAGVEVFVFEGNIYDASDGVGDYGANGCAFGDGLPAIPTDNFFDSWNGAIATAVIDAGHVPVDMHAHFYGHGYASSPNWYAPDCTHPSAVGHDELRRLFYAQITGEALP